MSAAAFTRPTHKTAAIVTAIASFGYQQYVQRQVARKEAETNRFEQLLGDIRPGNEAETVVALGPGRGKGLLVVDDLVDTGQTAKLVRDMLPDAHFAAVYAKPMGRPLVDTFITEVSQDTWIFFPWDTGLAFQPPIRDGAA